MYVSIVFFRRLISEISGPPNFATCSVVTVIYNIESEIWGITPKKIGGPKTSKIRRDFGQLRDLLNMKLE